MNRIGLVCKRDREEVFREMSGKLREYCVRKIKKKQWFKKEGVVNSGKLCLKIKQDDNWCG